MTKTGQCRRCTSASNWLEARGALALGAMLVTLATAAPAAKAQTYTVLHSFNMGDGAIPWAGLIRDSAGNLYGTTAEGGADGYGVVFKLDTAGTETVLHSFTGGADGSTPFARLTRDSTGNLYGTAIGGGDHEYGVVFMVDTTGTEKVLYNFTGGADGGVPFADLIRDSAGNLYGTTGHGGDHTGAGVVFKLDTAGTETVLYTFTGGTDGSTPQAGLIWDGSSFYGTTTFGGAYGYGAVFKLDKTGETVLYSFTGGTDGANPTVGLIRDSTGNFYGTANEGGIVNTLICDYGCGVVFKLDTTGTEKVLYSFTGGTDGAFPHGMARDSTGNFYGTANEGGIVNTLCNYGCGVVFKLDAAGTETVLYSFTNGTDGAYPVAGLISDSEGNLYGTASNNQGDAGFGVVFRLQP